MDSDKMADIFIVIAIIAILIAKIVGWITWPWIWIASIVWIPLVLGVVLCILVMCILIITTIINKIKEINK